MGSKVFRLSGSYFKRIQALAKAGDVTESELLRDLIKIGLGRIELRINQKIIDARNNE